MRDYKNILAWQKADDLTVAIYETTRPFPREEIYSLTSQLRRAAYSVPANIAEGASRRPQKDYLHFLYIARGSAAEVAYFIHLSRRLGYLEEDAHARLSNQAEETSRVLTGLIRAVEKEIELLDSSPVSGLQSPVSL
jgi:four helix bundle protein